MKAYHRKPLYQKPKDPKMSTHHPIKIHPTNVEKEIKSIIKIDLEYEMKRVYLEQNFDRNFSRNDILRFEDEI